MAKIFNRLIGAAGSGARAKKDKGQSPDALINDYIIQASKDLSEVKANTAAVTARADTAKKNLEANDAEIAKLSRAAANAADMAKALPEGCAERENIVGDMRKILTRKTELVAIGAGLREKRDLAVEQADMMISAHNRLVDEINELKSRRDSLKSIMSVTEAQEIAGRYTGGDVPGELSQFGSLEGRAEELLARSRAASNMSNSTESLLTDVAADRLAAEQKVEDELDSLLS